MKPCQSKQVLSIDLNDLFPGCLTEVVGASIGSSALYCMVWTMHVSALLIVVPLNSRLAVLLQASVHVLISGFRPPMYVKKAEADQ